MERLIDALTIVTLLAAGFWFGKGWTKHLVQSAEDKAEEILAERNYWKDIARESIDENRKLGREIATVVRFVRDAKLEPNNLPGANADDGDPPSVRSADRAHVERKRADKGDPVTRRRGSAEAGVPLRVEDKTVPPSPAAIERDDD